MVGDFHFLCSELPLMLSGTFKSNPIACKLCSATKAPVIWCHLLLKMNSAGVTTRKFYRLLMFLLVSVFDEKCPHWTEVICLCKISVHLDRLECLQKQNCYKLDRYDSELSSSIQNLNQHCDQILFYCHPWGCFKKGLRMSLCPFNVETWYPCSPFLIHSLFSFVCIISACFSLCCTHAIV